jgi:hypothetical protein
MLLRYHSDRFSTRANRMATNRNFTNFRAVYDELTDEVARSRPQFLPDHLNNWLALIDETPGIRDIVRKIESSPGLEQFEFMNRQRVSKSVLPPPPFPGSRPPGPLQWPADREKRLGMMRQKSSSASAGNDHYSATVPTAPVVPMPMPMAMPIHLSDVTGTGIARDSRRKWRVGGCLRNSGQGRESQSCDRNRKCSPYHFSSPWHERLFAVHITREHRAHNTRT